MTEVVPSSALSEVSLRLLCHDDIDTVKHLCGDWFPIEYPDSWYRDITSNKKFFSLAATYRGAIVGMIVAEIKSRTKIHKEDGDILASSFSVDTQVAYILSLGVVKEFRKHGIGSTARPTVCSAASCHGPASPPRAASSTAGPCDTSQAASTRPHPLVPCGNCPPGHLTSAVLCRGAPAAGLVLRGLGSRASRGMPGLRQALPALLPVWKPALPLSAGPAPRTSLWGRWGVACALWSVSSAALGARAPKRASLPASPHPSLASSPPLPVPSSSFLQSGNELLGGKTLSVVDRLHPKDTGASEQCRGKLKGAPDSRADPVHRSLGRRAQPLPPHPGLVLGGHSAGGLSPTRSSGALLPTQAVGQRYCSPHRRWEAEACRPVHCLEQAEPPVVWWMPRSAELPQGTRLKTGAAKGPGRPVPQAPSPLGCSAEAWVDADQRKLSRP
nr:N-alpha-acetyltransferase 60 isoform X1 [Camelus dromedarius]XP_031303673.1 N-alpha-acetyltransferase 60 isoform X1 [Camelus dromedarius]